MVSFSSSNHHRLSPFPLILSLSLSTAVTKPDEHRLPGSHRGRNASNSRIHVHHSPSSAALAFLFLSSEDLPASPRVLLCSVVWTSWGRGGRVLRACLSWFLFFTLCSVSLQRLHRSEGARRDRRGGASSPIHRHHSLRYSHGVTLAAPTQLPPLFSEQLRGSSLPTVRLLNSLSLFHGPLVPVASSQLSFHLTLRCQDFYRHDSALGCGVSPSATTPDPASSPILTTLFSYFSSIHSLVSFFFPLSSLSSLRLLRFKSIPIPFSLTNLGVENLLAILTQPPQKKDCNYRIFFRSFERTFSWNSFITFVFSTAKKSTC